MPDERTSRPRTRAVLALAWAALILTLTSIPGSHAPSLPFPHFDKTAHAGAYAMLGFLIVWSAVPAWLAGRRVRWCLTVGLIGAIYGAIDEIHQVWVPDRYCSISDWLCDTFGALGGAAAWLIATRKSQRHQESTPEASPTHEREGESG